jgi:ATP-dependent Clp protease ATP-binding subunit ClpA
VQAIDLIDEAGSRVRLRHAQLPEEARDLDKELRALLKEKDAAVRGQVCTASPPPPGEHLGAGLCCGPLFSLAGGSAADIKMTPRCGCKFP